jgi:signal transduction histidine kinase/CHASE1-domain containing sensor protein/ActR/RegA family two-component response regulator
MRGGRRFAPFGLPVLVLLIGLASTALVGVYLERAFAAEDAERFEVAADRLEDSIRERLETYIAMLRAEAGLLGATEMPSAAEFHAFVSRLELPTRYRGLQGIGYTARIAPEALASVEAQRRTEAPGFHVWPTHARDEYHAILFLEPMDRRNAAALGYDMFTEPIRREAMERARDSGEPAASGRVTLVQEIDEKVQAGFLIYVPVYEGGDVPPSVDERRTRLRGFVYSPFRAGDLFEGILGRNPRPRVGFEFYDGEPAAGRALYETPRPADPPRFVTRRAIRLAGREWNASVFSTAALERTAGAGLLPFAMWGGVGVSLLLTALATLQAHARRRAELSEAAAAQASRQLQTQAETLAIVHRSGTQLAAELDLDRLLQAVVDTATQLTGAQLGLFFCNATLPEPGAYARYVATDTPRHLRGRLSEGDGPFRNVILPSSIVRVDDLTGNPRAADEASAAGLPTQMRSYLAVPVRSRGGTPLGALLFGHATAGGFSSQSEDIVGGIAAQTAIAVDNACLYGQVQHLLASEREARENAERVSRLKDEFLATLSHELRTPLNAVIGWAHMLSGGRLDEARQRTALDAVLRNARIQSQLIEDLLDMSRIISGRVRIDMAHVDLQTVTRAAVDVLTPTAAARRVAVHFEPPATPCVVRGDAGRLQQVAWNLLSNAIKFTAPGGRVDLDLECRDDQVSLTVTDSGMGIDPAFLPHVFDRFRQADSSLTRGHGGLGLGLSIVRSLVDMHGGTVSAQSDGLNRGASFTVTLPGAPQGAVAADSVTGQTPAARPASSVLEGLQILVVEDDADARELTSDILRLHGARVHVAASGIDALGLLEAHDLPVDLIVSDIGMPQLDGYTLIGRVRALPGRQVSRAPAVALTAYAGAEDQQRALAAGFDVHLAKPFTPDELVAACEALAGQSRQIRSSRS